MKHKSNLFIFAMLFIVPAVSWLFMRDGLDFRIQSFEEMSLNEKLADSLLSDYGIGLKDKVTFIEMSGSDEIINGVFNQFKDAPSFQLITNSRSKIVDEAVNVYYIDGDTLKSILDKNVIGLNQYALVDGRAEIRKVYKDDLEKEQIVKHIATLLPFVDKNTRRRDGKQ
jgi:hypothetical protein